eukprot:g25731.t1
MFAGKGTAGKWEAFKNEITRVQRQYVPVRMKGKAEEEILDTLKHIKVDKSLGPDQVYPRTLSEAGKVIAATLAQMFVSLIVIEVTKRIDEGRAVDVIYMDFSKAFKKLPHGRLVSK